MINDLIREGFACWMVMSIYRHIHAFCTDALQKRVFLRFLLNQCYSVFKNSYR